MKTFHCDVCDNLVFFENVKCLSCKHNLGFLPAAGALAALEPGKDGSWRAPRQVKNDSLYRQCDNARQYQICNWMVDANDPNPLCLSCRLNKIIPDLSRPENLELWHKLELAKRRLVYTLMRMGLSTGGSPAENRPALRFNFVGDNGNGDLLPMTGHLNGLIVINIAEADDAERERRRLKMREPFRTLLGHLRHESGHYFWDILIAGRPRLPRFRELFGDETADYGAALKNYYDHGPLPDWQARHVSAYASAHPWEDWAETWAHYFHIMDMMETANSFGLTLSPEHPAAKSIRAVAQNPFDKSPGFDAILRNWIPLTHALNSLNRGMGLPDVYPFVLSPMGAEKMRFVHEVVYGK